VYTLWRHELFPNVINLNVKIPKKFYGIFHLLGEHCPKVRLSQDRMPIEPLTQQQSWVRGKGLFPLPNFAAG